MNTASGKNAYAKVVAPRFPCSCADSLGHVLHPLHGGALVVRRKMREYGASCLGRGHVNQCRRGALVYFGVVLCEGEQPGDPLGLRVAPRGLRKVSVQLELSKAAPQTILNNQ